jgi:hypothetical protein
MALFRVHVVANSNYVTMAPGFFSTLENLFSRCQQGSDFDDFTTTWWTHRPMGRAGHEPIVWMLPNKAASLIKKVYPGVALDPSSGGTTYWKDKGTISEVYMDYQALISPAAQAKMAFHELMHNKLQKGKELHSTSYGNGLNLGSINFSDDGTALDWDNKEMMGAALSKVVPQYEPPFN